MIRVALKVPRTESANSGAVLYLDRPLSNSDIVHYYNNLALLFNGFLSVSREIGFSPEVPARLPSPLVEIKASTRSHTEYLRYLSTDPVAGYPMSCYRRPTGL